MNHILRVKISRWTLFLSWNVGSNQLRSIEKRLYLVMQRHRLFSIASIFWKQPFLKGSTYTCHQSYCNKNASFGNRSRDCQQRACRIHQSYRRISSEDSYNRTFQFYIGSSAHKPSWARGVVAQRCFATKHAIDSCWLLTTACLYVSLRHREVGRPSKCRVVRHRQRFRSLLRRQSPFSCSSPCLESSPCGRLLNYL